MYRIPLLFSEFTNNLKVTSLNQKKFSFQALPPALLLFLWINLFTIQTRAQNLDVPYVSTPQEVVNQMLDIAKVGPGDYVIDLGSGDGRIVISAAQRGAVGHGVDLDPNRIEEANENASSNGVTDQVMFLQEDIFETDFSQASVVTMYLLSSVNLDLRPQLLEELEPGTRVVSHSFDMGEWEPDEQISFENRNINYWVIPADAKGEWQWETENQSYQMSASQEFQKVSAILNSTDGEIQTNEVNLCGDRITIIAENRNNGDRFLYHGKVKDDEIKGTVQIRNSNQNKIEPWIATRDS